MKKLFVILSFLISVTCFTTQSWALPPCPTSGIKHNCYGTFTSRNGNKYEGAYRDNRANGQGTYTIAKGMKYVGEMKDGMFNGHGTFYFKTGSKYVGEFKENKFDGQGTFTWVNKSKYTGKWKNNKKNGQGTYFFLDGSKYIGEWKDDKFHGEGTRFLIDGDKYEGEFKDNKYNGQGTYFYLDGSTYIGEWKDGKWNGLGTGSFMNGYKYVGEWKNSKEHGKGWAMLTNGTFKEGVWHEGKFLKEQNIKTPKKLLKGLKPDFSPSELSEIISQIGKEKKSKPKTILKTEPKSEFSNKPINVNFKSITKRPDDIAVIIGNANYEKMGKDIPNVNPAYADAEGIKKYFMQAKGIKEGNIIYLKDATAAQLLGTFGDSNSHKGQLYNWVKPNVSNVYIYYAGHGVPGGDKGNAYLVPTDADSQTIQFSGYPLSTLYSNLGKLTAKSITVILEACFSGASQAGNLFAKSSPIVIRAKKTMIPKNVKVISAGAVDQMASWEQDNSHGLFTKYFLKAMSGEGDKNNDGKVSDTELKDYLGETMTYYARRYYGRDQNVQIMQGN